MLKINLAAMRNYCYTVCMRDQVTISSRGAITIPAKLREAMGLQANDVLILETTDKGILVRPSMSIPVELYSEERISEFSEEDEAIGKLFRRQQ